MRKSYKDLSPVKCSGHLEQANFTLGSFIDTALFRTNRLGYQFQLQHSYFQKASHQSVSGIAVCPQTLILTHTFSPSPSLLFPACFILVPAGEEVHCSLVCEASTSCRPSTSQSSTTVVSSVLPSVCHYPLTLQPKSPLKCPLTHRHIVGTHTHSSMHNNLSCGKIRHLYSN